MQLVKLSFSKGRCQTWHTSLLGGKAEYESNLIIHIFWGCSSPPPKPQPPLLKPNYHQALHYNIKGGAIQIFWNQNSIFFKLCTSLRYISSFKSSITTIIFMTVKRCPKRSCKSDLILEIVFFC